MSDKSNSLSISARNLGSVLLATYCPKCLWYLLRMRFHPPFQHGGGAIFSSMEKISKAIVGYHIEKDGELPKEFAPFCNCGARAEYPRHWSKFSYQHESGVILYGIPDDIFVLSDGNLCVVDYKTARHKGEDDPYLPQYRTQVIGYANIAEGLGLGTVTKAGLIYFEVQPDEIIDDPGSFYKNGQVLTHFVPKPLELDVDYSILDEPLDEVKRLWKASTPPDGRDGCDDCKRLNLLFGIEDETVNKDLELRQRFPELQFQIERRMFDRRCAHREALYNSERGIHLPSFFDPNGMIENLGVDPA